MPNYAQSRIEVFDDNQILDTSMLMKDWLCPCCCLIPARFIKNAHHPLSHYANQVQNGWSARPASDPNWYRITLISVRANQRTPFCSQPEYATNEWREYVRCMEAATEIQRWVEIHTGKGTECHSQLRKVYPAYVRGGRQTCQRRRIDGTENGLYW